MKIVIAPDKFKGSLSGIAFCEAVEAGILKHRTDIELVKCPLADGGDGTLETIHYYLGGEQVTVEVQGPLQKKLEASYLYASESRTAFLEMSAAAGIKLLSEAELNPLETSTYGVGELLKDAIEKGTKRILLGIGGSATNDAGMGMARALGYRFLDKDDRELLGRGADLLNLHRIDDSQCLPELKNLQVEVACDVDNPLYGPSGAAFVYAPQKGADPDTVALLDQGLQQFNRVVNRQYGMDLQAIRGAGAAGGLGAGCVFFLSAKLKSGISLIKEMADFDRQIEGADMIITGEGQLDEQTFSGKVIKGVLESRTTQKLAVFCGKNNLAKDALKKHRIDYLAQILDMAESQKDSIAHAETYLRQVAEAFIQSQKID